MRLRILLTLPLLLTTVAASAQTAPPSALSPTPATPPATAPADVASTPAAVVDNLTRQILVILRDPKIERLDKRRQVRDLASQQIDFETLARLTLGQHWRGLSEQQRTDFVKEFKQHLAATYGHTTDEYTDEDIKPAGDRQEANGDWTVLTRILGTKNGTRQEVAKVDYRLRKKDNVWKIIDVTIDGVSLMANFRSQFQDIMTNGGIDKLLQLLREKNAAADK